MNSAPESHLPRRGRDGKPAGVGLRGGRAAPTPARAPVSARGPAETPPVDDAGARFT